MAISGELPELRVFIPDTETKGDPKPFTVYKITIEAPSEGLTWRMEKRYSDLNDFHHTLKRVFKDVPGFPRFPGKKLIHALDPEFIESRRAALEEYLCKAFSLPPILRSHQIRTFLAAGARSQSVSELESIDMAALGRSLGIATSSGSSGSLGGIGGGGGGAGGSTSSSGDVRIVGSAPSSSVPSPALQLSGSYSPNPSDSRHGGDHRYSAISLTQRRLSSRSIPESGPVNYQALPVESIHYFVTRGDITSVQAMIERDAGALEATDEAGQRPLVVAIKTRQAAVIEYLLSRGASADTPDLKGVAPLVAAAQRGDYHIFTLILTNCNDVTVSDPSTQSTVLHLFALNFEPGHPTEERLAELLIQRGARVAAQDVRGNIPLHYAAQQGNLVLMKHLIAANSPIDIQNNDDESPLHYAARAGKQRAVSCLVQEGADVNLKGKEGTPLDLVLKKRAARQAEGATD